MYGNWAGANDAWANRKLLVAVQIETAGSTRDLEDEIVPIEGLDSVIMGPFDLSDTVDTLGNVDGPVVVGASIPPWQRAGRQKSMACGMSLVGSRQFAEQIQALALES